MKALLAPLAELADYQDIRRERDKESGLIQIAGCVNSQKTHLMYALGDGCEYRVIAFSSEEKAGKACEECRLFTDRVYLYPARDLLFYYADIKGNLLTDRRMEVLRALIEKKDGEPVTVITTMDAFLDGLASPAEISRQRICLTGGGTVDLADLEMRLAEMKYERVVQIEGPGQFAVRGGIIDIYPLTEELPVRIELWDDEIDSIRSLMWRASGLWKIWKRSRSIRLRKTGRPVLRPYHFWIISRRIRPFFFWMNRNGSRRCRRRRNRNTSGAGRTVKKKMKRAGIIKMNR